MESISGVGAQTISSSGNPLRRAAARSADATRILVGSCGGPHTGRSIASRRLAAAVGITSPGLPMVEPRTAPSAPIHTSPSGR